MKYFVVILAVVALTSGAALPTPAEDVTAADFEESVAEISKQYGQFVPGLGYVSYYSPLWNHIKDMSDEELNIFIEELHALHHVENEEDQVTSRRKDNAYGEHIEGLGFVNYHNPLWSIIKHFDSEELEAFVSQLHQHNHRPIPYAQQEEAEDSPNDDQNAEDEADAENSFEEEANSNGEEGKAQNEQGDEENQDEAQDDSDADQEEGRDEEDEQIDEENENEEGRDGEDENDDKNSGENQEYASAKADEDGDVAAEELDDDVEARQNENEEDNDASEAESGNNDTNIADQAKL